MNDPTDMHTMCVKPFAYLFYGHASFPHLSHCANFVFAEPRGSVATSDGLCAVADFIRLIFSYGRPTQVIRSIVMAVSIPVRDDVLRRWTRAMERQADHDVNRDSDSLPKRDLQVMALSTMAKDEALEKGNSTVRILYPSVYGSHPAEVGCFVAWMTRHGAPFFDMCYAFLSHFAAPKRCGQGMTEGANRPSFPHFIMEI